MNTTSSTNNPELTTENIEEIKKALYQAESVVADTPKKIHMTRDFFDKLRAMMEETGILRPFPKNDGREKYIIIPHFAGIPLQIHDEQCEKEYWFDYEDDAKNAAAFGWIFRKDLFIKKEIKPFHFPES